MTIRQFCDLWIGSSLPVVSFIQGKNGSDWFLSTRLINILDILVIGYHSSLQRWLHIDISWKPAIGGSETNGSWWGQDGTGFHQACLSWYVLESELDGQHKQYVCQFSPMHSLNGWKKSNHQMEFDSLNRHGGFPTSPFKPLCHLKKWTQQCNPKTGPLGVWSGNHSIYLWLFMYIN